MSNILTIITVLSLGGLTIFFIVDKHITNKRLKINQRDWNEYSKDMSIDEKRENINAFLLRQKAKYHWGHLYVPSIYASDTRDTK